MKVLLFSFSMFILFSFQNYPQTENSKPPLAPVNPVEDVYFGKKVVDPYRYMENMKDASVATWMKAQSDYARGVLNSIPGRQALIEKRKEFDRRESSNVNNLRITDNDVYFYLKTTPSDETGMLYTRNGFEGEETLLYDPASFSRDMDQKYVINTINPSDDGSLVAFSMSANGSESAIILIMNVETKKLFPEQIDLFWFGEVSWLPGNKSFLFNRLNSGDVHDVERVRNTKVYLHTIGTEPSADKEFFSNAKNPGLGIKPEDIPIVIFAKDSKYLFAALATVDNRLNLFYAPASELNNSSINWKRLFKPEDEVYFFYPAYKDIYFCTPKNAPHLKILKTSIEKPDVQNAEVIVPENPEGTITNFGLTNEGLYYTISKNGVESDLYYLPNGAKDSKKIELPFTAGSLSLSNKGVKFPDVWVTISGWTSDSKRFRYLPDKNEFKSENLSAVAEFPEFDDLIVEELMIPSHDGVKVPLSLVYKKGLKKDGNNPVLIYGYGSYGFSTNPFFSPGYLLWTTKGGIFAVAHVRGGSELGDTWYKGGYKETKPNTWKDLISCTEYLIKENYTSPKKVAINGVSAGGILIGRAMTERPDLFAAAIPEVGDLNSVRAEESPAGPVNIPEFGTVKDSAECMALIEMDAYLHLQRGVDYPATFITAGMNDPRVIAWGPAKFAARLQAENASDKPILFWVDYEAGHGIGNTKSKNFESLADLLSFALWQTGHPDYQLK